MSKQKFETLQTPSRLSALTLPFRWFWRTSLFKKLIIIAILAGAAGYWYWSSINNGIEVETSFSRRGDLVESISASGEVQAKEAATLAFQTSGRLSWVGVAEGDEVRKGQAVASLDRTQLQATLKKYLNAYEREFTEFKDTSDSADDVTLNDSVARIKKRAQVDLDQTVIDVEIQQEALRLATLYTPVSGIVTKADPKFAGVNVGPTTGSYQIVNPQTVYFEAEVNEVDVIKLRPGTQVKLQLDAYPDEILTETIQDISFASTQTSTGGTAYKVEITLPSNDNFKFRLGMNGDADFVLSEKKDVLLIPQTAVVEIDDKTYVWIVNTDNTVTRKEVKTGISSIDEIEIVEGLEPGENIVIRAPRELEEGAKIKVQTD